MLREKLKNHHISVYMDLYGDIQSYENRQSLSDTKFHKSKTPLPYFRHSIVPSRSQKCKRFMEVSLPCPAQKAHRVATVRLLYIDSVFPRVRRKGGCLPCRSDCREAAVRRGWISCRNGCRRSSQKCRRDWYSRCQTGCYCCCRCSGWSPPGSAGQRGRRPRSAPQ